MFLVTEDTAAMKDRQPQIAIRQAVALIAALLMVICPLTIGADSPPETTTHVLSEPEVSSEGKAFDLADRQAIYEKAKLSYGSAIGYNLILPGWGNLYAEQFFTAGAVLGALMFSTILIGYGVINDQNGYTHAGVGVAGVAYSSSIAIGIWGVSEYNRGLRSSLKIDEFAPRPPKGLSLTLTF